MNATELMEKARALLAKMPDAARVGVDRELLVGVCDALAAAENRADEAEARERGAVNARIETSHDLHIRLELAEASAAAWRQHTAALVAAMKTWGSWEDGVPCESDGGEYGEVGAAFNAAHDAIHPGGNFASWRCSSCGETATVKDSSWRWNGTAWQHTHADSPQAGHFDAVCTADPGAALLARLHAAESEVQRLRKDWDNALHAATSTMRSELRVALREVEPLRAEVDRLKAENAAAALRLVAVGEVLSAHGCDCDCGCDTTGHFDECDLCLACKVNEAITDP